MCYKQYDLCIATEIYKYIINDGIICKIGLY